MPTGRKLPKDWKGNKQSSYSGVKEYYREETIESLKEDCKKGNQEACAKLEKIQKENEEFLEHLMTIE